MIIDLHDQLINLYELFLNNKIPNTDFGICHNLDLDDTQVSELHKLILSWPERNVRGGTDYPVEGSSAAYLIESKARTLWDNPRRLDLLNHLLGAT